MLKILTSRRLFPAIALTTVLSMQAQKAWTLQDCIDYASEHNLELRQKQISLQQSEVDIEARKGALFPSLSFSTNQNGSWRPWSNSYVNISNGSFSSTTSTVNYNGSYGFQAQWTVWDGGINRRQLARSRLSKDLAEADREITRLSLEEQIAQLYVQNLYQADAVVVCRNILESTAVQLERAQAMYEVGSMSRADLAQVEAQMSQERYNLANAQTQLSEFRMQLRQLLELPSDMDFTVETPDAGDEAVMTILPTIADVYAVAAENRPELRYSRLGIESADIDIDIARRGYYPTVSLAAGINTSASSGLEFNWAKQMKTNLSNSVGLTISVPIFDNKKNSTNVARARLDKENSEIALSQQQRQLYNDIETIWLNADNAQRQYTFALDNATSMRESYSLVNEQFAVGLKDVVDLSTAKNNLIQAEQQLLRAKYTALLNSALLRFYQGAPISL